MITEDNNSTDKMTWCLVCGDVTDGHPALDEIYVEILNNGCTTHYTKQ